MRTGPMDVPSSEMPAALRAVAEARFNRKKRKIAEEARRSTEQGLAAGGGEVPAPVLSVLPTEQELQTKVRMVYYGIT